MSWAKAGVIFAGIGAIVPTAGYIKGVWEEHGARSFQAGYEKGVREADDIPNSKVQKLETEKSVLLDALEKSDTALHRMVSDNAALKTELQQTAVEVKRLASQTSDARIEITSIERQLIETQRKLANSEESLKQAQSENQTAAKKIENLTEQIFNLQNSKDATVLQLQNGNPSQSKAVDSADCAGDGDRLEIPLNGFFEECMSGNIVSYTYANSRLGIMNVKLTVLEQESRLRLNESVAISEKCSVRFLSFAREGENKSPALFRVEC